jgi:hypothetical protein
MKMTVRAFFISLLTLIGVSCNKNQDAQTKAVTVASLQPGPIKHAELTETQLDRINRLKQVLAEVDNSSLETWIDNFKRDANPDQELAVWERIAAAYTTYCSQRSLSLKAKKDVHTILLLRSMASENEVIKQVKLDALTVDDAKQVMKLY